MGAFEIIFILIWGAAWGGLSGKLIYDKGYDNGTVALYFVFGFCLSIFGVIAAYFKEDLYKKRSELEALHKMRKEAEEGYTADWWCSCGELNPASSDYCISCGNRKPNTRSSTVSSAKAKDTDWRCSCGALNKEYETSCHRCGTLHSIAKKTVNQSAEPLQQEPKIVSHTTTTQQSPVVTANSSITNQITEIKSLLDSGLITEEEFNAKKKQILGL